MRSGSFALGQMPNRADQIDVPPRLTHDGRRAGVPRRFAAIAARKIQQCQHRRLVRRQSRAERREPLHFTIIQLSTLPNPSCDATQIATSSWSHPNGFSSRRLQYILNRRRRVEANRINRNPRAA